MEQELLNGMEFKNSSWALKRRLEDNNDEDANSMERQKTIRFRQDTGQRRTLVNWMMFVVSIWLGAVLSIVILSKWLGIEKEVLITLLATTTINVLGLANIILQGLFGRRPGTRQTKKRQDNPC